MIYSLRRKLIWICGASVIAVFIIIFALIYVFSTNQLNSAMDVITDRISQNDGVFPELDDEHPLPEGVGRFPDFITAETKFSTRFFTVYFDKSGEISSANTESVSSVTNETAYEYAQKAVAKNKERGWIDGYRYKIYGTSFGQAVVFVDGNMNRSVANMTVLSAGAVLVGSLIIILVLIIIFSKKAVKPIAESYEKQKQFITDANHELKTPLTLVLTNLDIVETETGKNEWLDDIRAECERMNALVRQLVTLTKMDEEENGLSFEPFSISGVAVDTISEFAPLADSKGIRLSANVQPDAEYIGDEAAIRRVFSILLDNAIKYCDNGGQIEFVLRGKKRPVITVENSCSEVNDIELKKLFDRFYRADKSRTFTGGFGIGLSIAQAIVHRHHGEICAYKKNSSIIGFKVTLK